MSDMNIHSFERDIFSDEDNQKLFDMINPLYKTFLWNFKSLDINYPFIIICTIIIYKLFKFDLIIK